MSATTSAWPPPRAAPEPSGPGGPARAVMAIELLYGRGRLALSPPAGCIPTVIEKRAMPLLPDPLGAGEQAPAAPVDGPPPREPPRRKPAACVAIRDRTRP